MRQIHLYHLLTQLCVPLQALHAAELAVDHPATGERMHFSGASMSYQVRASFFQVTIRSGSTFYSFVGF
jgi:hypothetical protein